MKYLLMLTFSFIFFNLSKAQKIEWDGDKNVKQDKIQTSIDDAFGILDKGELINTIGNQGIISDGYYQNLIYNFRWPKSKGVANIQGVNATDDFSILFGHKGNVLDSYTRYRNEDWQGIPGSQGKYFAFPQPSELLAPDGAPRLAHSDIPRTWPAGYIDSLGTFHDAPKGAYNSLSDADKALVNSKGAEYDAENNVWRFWPGRFRIDVDNKSPNFGKQVIGEFAGDREIYAIYDDHNAQLPSTPIGLVVQQQAYCYGRKYAEDFHFYDFLITNKSNEVLDSCWWGYYVDFQFGDSGDETWGSYNSNSDTYTNDNVFYQFDFNGPSPGNIENGYIGTAVFNTPNNFGITDAHFFRDLSGSITPGSDPQIWPVMTSNKNDPDINPGYYFHGSNVKFDDFSLTQLGNDPGPNNWSMYVCSGPFTLQPGQTVRATIAVLAGQNLQDLKKNVAMAQKMVKNEFNGPAAPPSPKVYGASGDGKVTIYWDDSPEYAVDPVSKQNDFEGYKIYRSDDLGATWGPKINDAQGNLYNYVPIAQFDKIDLIQGIDPVNNYNFLGSNTGISHYFVDKTAKNGITYSYTVTAYDSGSISTGIESLESSRGTTAADANLVDLTPVSKPIGYAEGNVTIKQISGIGNGQFDWSIADKNQLTNDKYQILFNKNPADSFYVKNTSTDKILAKTLLASNEMVVTDGFTFNITGDTKTGGVKSVIDELGNSVQGSKDLNNINHWFVDFGSSNQLADTSSIASDYEFKFTSDGSFAAGLTGQHQPMIKKYTVPYEIWNVAHPNNPVQVNSILIDKNNNGQLDLGEDIRIVNVPYDVRQDTLGIFSIVKWYYTVKIDTVSATNGSLPENGQLFTIFSYSELSTLDTFNVTINKPVVKNDFETVKAELNNIRVVPNPYVVSAKWEQFQNNPNIRFMYLPSKCTITIYTIAGNLVKRLYHDNSSGDEVWNLTNESGVEVAYGVYLYIVKTSNGAKKINKFAIIK